MNDSRGALWRKWDLHVHTPQSYEQQFGDNWDSYFDELKKKAVYHDVEVMGVTDYFSLDGYERLLKDYCNGEPAICLSNGKVLHLLPCVELRVEVLDQRGASLNVHVIFDNRTRLSTIRSKFLDHLKFRYKDQTHYCRELELVAVGIAESSEARFTADLDLQAYSDDQRTAYKKAAYRIISITMDSLIEALEVFRKVPCECLVAAANTGHGSLSNMPWLDAVSGTLGRTGNMRQSILNHVDICFTHKIEDRTFLLGQDEGTKGEEFLDRFGSFKLCLWGSDAHSAIKIFEPNGDPQEYTWVKADPCLRGLRQACIEPAERAFIGPLPPSMVTLRDNPTRYVRELSVEKKSGSGLSEVWFDGCKLRFNPGLVAIIGNKGSGKSALADIIALLGDSHQGDKFSFLTRGRFLKDKRASHFTATLTWNDGQVCGPIALDRAVSADSVERIRYIPQNFFEEVCNDLESTFENELKKVIFAHLDETERLGTATLDDWISRRADASSRSLDEKRIELKRLNQQISQLEKRLSSSHRSSLENRRESLRRELDAHLKQMPEEVRKPVSSNPQSVEIERLQKMVEEKGSQIQAFRVRQASNNERIVKIDSLNEELLTLRTQVEGFLSRNKPLFDELQVDPVSLIDVKFDMTGLSQKRASLQEEITQLSADVTTTDGDKQRLERELKAILDGLKGEDSRYQVYVAQQDAWEKRRRALLGGPDEPNSLGFYDNEVAKLGCVPAEKAQLVARRAGLLREIHQGVRQIASIYGDAYRDVQRVIEEHPIVKNELKASFGVTIAVDEHMKDGFFALVQKTGEFRGKSDELFSELLDKYDMSNADEVLSFIEELLNLTGALDVRSALRVGFEAENLYDFLYSIEYLQPRYGLSLNGKQLEQLSPGERGALMLVFYLLLDKDNIPLIVDQPEENLDNQTVYEVLVPCFRDVKQRRQVFIVTHNPNLAVVCDAEQIIYAGINKRLDYQVTYQSGAIECGLINEQLLDVLEGTRPAFDIRQAKYM